MFSSFFDKLARGVLLAETAGMVFLILTLLQLGPNTWLLTKIGLAIFCLQYAFLRFCHTFRWYQRAHRYEGIEQHFRKMFLAGAYVLSLTLLFVWKGATFFLWIGNLLLLVGTVTNSILLKLHLEDSSEIPINHFTSNRYLQDDSRV